MRSLIIVYQFREEGRKEPFINEIERKWDCTRVSDLCHAIRTEDEPEDVLLALDDFVTGFDLLYVFAVTGPWFGYGHPEAMDWLEGLE